MLVEKYIPGEESEMQGFLSAGRKDTQRIVTGKKNYKLILFSSYGFTEHGYGKQVQTAPIRNFRPGTA
ncbi:MAG: hypothetical protein JRI88_01305 [Deltaproteobacteria bacterium]|nr:hypothetical protein [Deltaproteobacteria bacterium]